jgi:hypothetical protein
MNETDVREEFLSPLLDRLGYRAGNEGNVSREQPLSLRYPRFYLGRKNKRTDPYLRGRADYVLEVRGHARWVLEAKHPSEEIDGEAIEQAWTYANHPEVRGVFFAISNGRRLVVFRSSSPPQNPPLLDIKFDEMEALFPQLNRLLGVEAIRNDYSDLGLVGEPVATGLRSFAKLAGGFVRYQTSNLEIPAITELQATIADGSLERGESGGLIASIQVRAPVASIDDMIRDLGLNRIPYESESSFLSDDPRRPTAFSYQGRAIFPKGRMLFDITSNRHVTLEKDVVCDIESNVRAYISGKTIFGKVSNAATYLTPIEFRLEFAGNLEVQVF